MNTLIGIRVERTCPRCNSRLYHTVWSQKAERGLKQDIKCAQCGHVWCGRLTHAEADEEFTEYQH
jgi:uncharacterized Zn finger protein